ncbi:hypothetical protein ACFSB1_01035 [Halopseudomonas phragmitis]|uniref:Tail terminator n=1 Tax=Halopseudomonas phragmitis TaxID=1931241 RepID=A0A1V0B6P1_9GAMM|nr:hypothetical protein [Halopseudomonas phragmitis]AQZ95561.1 hypothetical protein BVH74_12730 [Halopseudomonas phragmitis]
MSQPFDPQVVIDRLKPLQALQSVEGAAEYAAVTNLKDFRVPCAYVLLLQERTDDALARPAGRQRAIVTFGVVVAARNYGDQRGERTLEELRPLLGSVRARLMGWMPEVQGSRPVQWTRGDVLDYNHSTLLWADVYQTQHFIGGNPV